MMIDCNIQKSLRAKYNPEGSDLRKNQIALLEILRIVALICDKNNIPYWLSSGTLLGAVRHGGFIPWDDDIDIEILYKDRRRFIRACEKTLPCNFAVQTHTSDGHHYSSIIKIKDLDSSIDEYYMGDLNYPLDVKYKGNYIDVFTEENSFLRLVRFSNKLTSYIYRSHYIKKRPDWFCHTLYFLSTILFNFFRVVCICFSDKSVLYHSYGSGYQSCREKADIFPLGKLPFENALFSVPGDYDNYLKKTFGDYLSIPSVDMIKTGRHNKSSIYHVKNINNCENTIKE